MEGDKEMNLGIFRQFTDRILKGKEKNLGKRGEDIAENYLKKRGYKILARNFRIKGGEVDIIAEKDGEVVFVEVKTRSSEEFMPVIEAVDFHKRKRIRKAAEVFLLAKGLYAKPCRFDVITIVVSGRKVLSFDHIRNVQI